MKTLIQSVVISRLDCSNCAFVGMPLKSIRKLQLAHKAAARVVQKKIHHEHTYSNLKATTLAYYIALQRTLSYAHYI